MGPLKRGRNDTGDPVYRQIHERDGQENPPDGHLHAVECPAACRGCGERVEAEGLTDAGYLDGFVNEGATPGRLLDLQPEQDHVSAECESFPGIASRKLCHSTASQCIAHSTNRRRRGFGRASIVPLGTHASCFSAWVQQCLYGTIQGARAWGLGAGSIPIRQQSMPSIYDYLPTPLDWNPPGWDDKRVSQIGLIVNDFDYAALPEQIFH